MTRWLRQSGQVAPATPDRRLRRTVIFRCTTFEDVCGIIDDWMRYYNEDRYQWELAKLSPNEYYEYITTGIYPLKEVFPFVKEKEEGTKAK